MTKQQSTRRETWAGLARDTVANPRPVARRLLDLGLAPGDVFAAALAISCCGILIALVTARLGGAMIDDVSARLLATPLLAAALEFGVMLMVAWLTWWVGRLFGGTGTLLGAATLVVWLNAMLLLIQFAQLVLVVLLPPLAVVLALIGMFWALWAFSHFVIELHGFSNPLMVLGGVMLTGVVVLIALGILFAILGLAPHEVG